MNAGLLISTAHLNDIFLSREVLRYFSGMVSVACDFLVDPIAFDYFLLQFTKEELK